MRVLDTFAGIGGFSLGLERAGMQTVAFVEIDEFCRQVLAKNWPHIPRYGDIRDVTAQRLQADGIAVDIITAGFPCQDISSAGKQAGIDGERSGLWSECARLIDDVRPAYALLENVTALLSGDRGRWFGRVLGDLAAIGYDCEWHCIPAAHIGAPHIRDRGWIIAYPQHSDADVAGPHRATLDQHRDAESGNQQVRFAGSLREILANPHGQRGCSRNPERQDAENVGEPPGHSWEDGGSVGIWNSEPDVGRVADGVPRRVDRLRCLGNAIVPQIAEALGMAIIEDVA